VHVIQQKQLQTQTKLHEMIEEAGANRRNGRAGN